MTLVLTLMRPGEGIWQTVDQRVTKGADGDDFAPKQLSVHRQDGTMLVAYWGLAEVHPSGESMFDWIRSTLRGWARACEGDMVHLTERLNRDVARSPRRFAEQQSMITAAAVLGTRADLAGPLENPRLARWVISNLAWPDGLPPGGKPTVVRQFSLEGHWVDQPNAWAHGSGHDVVYASEIHTERLLRAVRQRPNKPLDYLGLLAKINRGVASRSKGTVSRWCTGTYMPQNKSGGGLIVQRFSERGDPEPPEPGGLPAIVFGLDTTDTTRQQQITLRDLKQGLDPQPHGKDTALKRRD